MAYLFLVEISIILILVRISISDEVTKIVRFLYNLLYIDFNRLIKIIVTSSIVSINGITMRSHRVTVDRHRIVTSSPKLSKCD